jgi:hypothetical protein
VREGVERCLQLDQGGQSAKAWPHHEMDNNRRWDWFRMCPRGMSKLSRHLLVMEDSAEAIAKSKE